MSFYKKVWYFTFNVGCIPTRPVTGCIQDWMHPILIDFSRRDNSLAGVRQGWQSKVNAFLIIITTLDMLIQHCQMLICRWWLHYFWLKSESHVKSFLMIFHQIIQLLEYPIPPSDTFFRHKKAGSQYLGNRESYHPGVRTRSRGREGP